MPTLETTHFGNISFDQESIFEFPQGMPGFEIRRRFVPVQNPHTAPVVFLQSIEEPSLCFTTLPILVVDPGYRLHVPEPDLEILGYPEDFEPRIGEDVLCLAVLTIRSSGTTANLLAPVVVNLKNHRAAQAVAQESEYSHRHPLFSSGEAVC